MRVILILLALCIAGIGNAKPKWKHKHKMALSDQLVAYYDFEQKFEEGFHAWNRVPPHNAALIPARLSALPIPVPLMSSVEGKVGKAIQLSSGAGLQGEDMSSLRLTGDKTITFWFMLDELSINNFLFWKPSEYNFVVTPSRTLRLVGDAGTQLNDLTPLNYGEWYFCMARFLHTGATTSTVHLRINKRELIIGTLNKQLAGSVLTIGGASLVGRLDELAFWDRVISYEEEAELYNDGDGLSYEDIVPPPTPRAEQCQEDECCGDVQGNENPFTYTATSGGGGSFDEDCFPKGDPPLVEFNPPSGSTIIMPSLVLMSSSIGDDIPVRYTTDGTDPTGDSTLFTTPVTISSPTTEIRAACFLPNCPHSGPVASAQYLLYPNTSDFTYACDTPDFVGRWGVFAADGVNDYHWRWDITFTAVTHILRVDVFKIDQHGRFTTGGAWSTQEFIHPWLDQPRWVLAAIPVDQQFRAMPLMLRIGGVTQNAAYTNDYSTSFGTFAAATHAIDLYGQPWTTLPANHAFKLLVTFSTGGVLSRVAKVIDTVCDALPPNCPVPAAPTLAPTCTGTDRIDVTFACPVGSNFKIFRSLTETSGYTELTSGVVASNPETYQDTTAAYGTRYYYYVSNQPAGCPAFLNSLVSTVEMLRLPSVSISATPSTIDPGGSSTISWDSSNVVGTITITAPIGVQAGNTPGSQSVSPGATTVYQIDGSNTCSNVSAQVTVTVNPAAACGASPPEVIEIVGYTDLFFDTSACSLAASAATPWNGRLSNFTGCVYQINGPASFSGGKALATNVDGISAIATLWDLFVYGKNSGGGHVLVWSGNKTVGTTAAGTYTRTGGCSASPTSLTIAVV